jgi:hypothetical protein
MNERRELNFGRFIGYAISTMSNRPDGSSELQCSHGHYLTCESSWDCIADYWNGYADKYITVSAEKNLQLTCMHYRKIYLVQKYLRVFNHMLKHSGIKYSNKCNTCSRFITRGTYVCQNFSCIAKFVKEIYPKYKAFRVKFNKKFQERLRRMEEEEMERDAYYDDMDDRARYEYDDRNDRYDDDDDDCGPKCPHCRWEVEPFSKWGPFCSYSCHPDYGRSYDSD